MFFLFSKFNQIVSDTYHFKISNQHKTNSNQLIPKKIYFHFSKKLLNDAKLSDLCAHRLIKQCYVSSNARDKNRPRQF